MNIDDELRKALESITPAQVETIKRTLGGALPESPNAEDLVLILHLITQERIKEIKAKALGKSSGTTKSPAP